MAKECEDASHFFSEKKKSRGKKKKVYKFHIFFRMECNFGIQENIHKLFLSLQGICFDLACMWNFKLQIKHWANVPLRIIHSIKVVKMERVSLVTEFHTVLFMDTKSDLLEILTFDFKVCTSESFSLHLFILF